MPPSCRILGDGDRGRQPFSLSPESYFFSKSLLINPFRSRLFAMLLRVTPVFMGFHSSHHSLSQADLGAFHQSLKRRDPLKVL